MSTESRESPSLSPAQQAFLECRQRICNVPGAQRLWERHLTPSDRDRLGGDFCRAYEEHQILGMWVTLRGVTRNRAVLDIGLRLNFLSEGDYQWLVREIGEFPNTQEAMTAAIAAGHLVLVEDPREVYWNGVVIDVDWNRYAANWEFLWVLSQQAKRGRSIDRLDFGDNSAPNIVTRRKHRLTSRPEFPVDLTDLIIPAGRGTQRLDLAPERIHLFVQDHLGEMVEWHPGRGASTVGP